ncbi:MAG TPA: LLM class flavin-dependent oxidoreductase [Candidatus Binatia bacterium]
MNPGEKKFGIADVGVWLQPTVPVAEIAALAERCDDYGFDFLGMTDGQMIWRDVYVALTLAASRTKRIRLGPWVSNIITRHPTVTANAISTLNELSGGRAFLGIGIGDDSVRTIGRKTSTLDELAEAVKLIYDLAAGREVKRPEGTWTLATAQGGMTIYWAAANPKSLQYGGRCTDGVIASGWLVPELLERIRNYILEGARQGGKDETGTETIFNTAVSISENRAEALNAAKPYVARALCYTSSTWLPNWSETDMKRFRSQYDYYHHFRPDQGLATLVPDSMVPMKAIAGTPDECAELLRMVVKAGFTKMSLIPMGDVASVIRLLATKVLPRL